MSQNSYRSMSRYSLWSKLPLLQLLSCPLLPNQGTSLPKGKQALVKGNQGKHNKCHPSGSGLNLRRTIGWPSGWEFQSLLQHPCDSLIQRLTCQQAVAFQILTSQMEKGGWWTTSPCLEVLGQRKYLPPKDFQGSCDYKEMRREETIALAVVLQSCTVQSGMPPGELCGVLQEFHQCLAPLIEEESLEFETLDVAKKDPMPTASAPTSSTPDPEEEDWVVQVPEESCTSEPAHLEGGLDLVLGRYPTIPLVSGCSWANQAHSGLVRGIPLGAQLDFCSLGSLQVTMSCDLTAREVCYEYQSQVITQASLQLPQFEPSEPSDSPPWIQELSVNTMLFLSSTSDSTTPWPQENWLEKLCSSPRSK